MQDLLQRLDLLAQEHQQEKLDHARESHFNREVQRREMKLQEELRAISGKMVRFVLSVSLPFLYRLVLVLTNNNIGP